MSTHYDVHDYQGLVALQEQAVPDMEVDKLARRIRWAAENYHEIEPEVRDRFTATVAEMLQAIEDELAWRKQATHRH